MKCKNGFPVKCDGSSIAELSSEWFWNANVVLNCVCSAVVRHVRLRGYFCVVVSSVRVRVCVLLESVVFVFQQWYTATMNLLGTWLTERMDQQLHVYQLKILIRITKVGRWGNATFCLVWAADLRGRPAHVGGFWALADQPAYELIIALASSFLTSPFFCICTLNFPWGGQQSIYLSNPHYLYWQPLS